MVKGFIKTIEASISIVLILVSIVFLFSGSMNQGVVKPESIYSCLENADVSGNLRYFAVNDMEAELAEELKYCIPSAFDYAVKVCSGSSCIAQSIPDNKDVFVSSYLIAGEGSFNPRLISIWVWLK